MDGIIIMLLGIILITVTTKTETCVRENPNRGFDLQSLIYKVVLDDYGYKSYAFVGKSSRWDR